MLTLDGLRRRELLLAAGGLWACVTPLARAAGAVLPVPDSLADELAMALKIGQPLVVMVSLEGCPFCRVARDGYLDPLRRQDGVPVVQIDMRSAVPVRDFKRASVTHDQITRTWGIKVAPTVLFFGRNGVEVAERMVGGYLPDFYAAYLDERLQQARRVLRTG